jgi:hypothetical protein
MSESKGQRINPRALLASVSAGNDFVASSNSVTVSAASKYSSRKLASKKLAKLVSITVAAVVGASAFGAIVVQANDDNSALMFMRQNARPISRSAPAYRSAPPVVYYAPQAFFPRSEPTRSASRQQRSVATAYAPFVGFFPTENSSKAPRRKVASVKSERPTLSLPEKSGSESEISIGGRLAYCVRTCDGFYFPLSTSTGSNKGDEAVCNSLCPSAETKVYVGTSGADVDNARNSDTGRIYASMSNAFSYRKGIDKSCSCTANGYGLANNGSVYKDGSLRVGDIVMTKSGMRIFSGGTFPYRDSNFASLGSGLIDNKTRNNLRRVEQASLPGRSGLAAAPVSTAKRDNEAKELKAATSLSERLSNSNTSTALRYIGPDRPVIAR